MCLENMFDENAIHATFPSKYNLESKLVFTEVIADSVAIDMTFCYANGAGVLDTHTIRSFVKV